MIISGSDLERQLSLLQERNLNPSWGLFGLDSLLWKVNRESVVLLGATRALLLQLSHPVIAAAVAEHSTVLNQPLKRLHQTFNIMFKMVFGTIEQSFEAARTLHRRHSSVRGHVSETGGLFNRGAAYYANDASLLQWVHATLVETAYRVYASAFTPLNDNERDQYYQESCRMAGLFGLSNDSLPPTWIAFREYFKKMCQSGTLSASANARDVVDHMFGKRWSRVPVWYQAVTAQLLPSSLREAFELPFGEDEQIKADRAWKFIRVVCPLLPYHLRYVGPYQEAQARIESKTPSLVTKSVNHLWIGRSTL